MSKYDPLRHHLVALTAKEWRASFAEIESVLGCRLPPSARKHQAWWGNETSGGRAQKRAWLSVGWETAELDIANERLIFRRAH